MNTETANHLLGLRKKHGYSEEELAYKIGVSSQTVSEWERAEASPDADNLIALSRLYQISLDELLCIEGLKEQQETEINDQSAGSDNTYGNNIIFNFKRNILQQTSLLTSADFVIDSKDSFRVAPDTSLDATLEVGEHAIRVSIPFGGNEVGVAITKIDIKQNMKYEVTYSMSSLSPTGTILVKEIAVGDSPVANNIKTTVTKGHKNYTFLFLIFFMVIMMGTISVLYSMNIFSHGKATVVTALNTPAVNSGLEITATEIKIVNIDGESAAAIYFEVENKSKKELSFYNSENLTYVDDVMAEEAYGENYLSSGNLASGKRVSGYLYYYIPKDAKKIEVKFEVEYEEKFNFSLNIPSDSIVQSETQTSMISASTESNNTESKSVESEIIESKNTENEAGKEVVVTALNTPGVNTGVKMTATEIKIVKPEYSEKSAVAVYFEVENQSEDKIVIFLPSAYVDGKKAELTIYGNENLGFGYLDSQKSMTGYLYYYITSDANKIEIKFDLGLNNGLKNTYTTFSLDIPPQ